MAGQFTLTKGPLFHGERVWTMRAMMSLPVPLSPWIRTGTLAAATLLRRSRTACMLSDRPKTTASGGNSPKAWTNALTGLLGTLGILKLTAPIAPDNVHPEHQTGHTSAETGIN